MTTVPQEAVDLARVILGRTVSPESVRRALEAVTPLLAPPARGGSESVPEAVDFAGRWSLTPSEARLLLRLSKARGQAVTCWACEVALHGSEAGTRGPCTLRTFVTRLRRKGWVIRSVWGSGYALEGPVERLQQL